MHASIYMVTLLVCITSTTESKHKKSHFNIEPSKNNNPRVDFKKLFTYDLKELPDLDEKIEKNLDKLLKNVEEAPRALDFIFQQALSGKLLLTLRQDTKIDSFMNDLIEVKRFQPIRVGATEDKATEDLESRDDIHK